MRVGLSGLTMAEYFRDEMGQDVLLFIDNIFTGTVMGPPVSFTEAPRWRPSVELMAMQRTTSSPTCCKTSAISVWPF